MSSAGRRVRGDMAVRSLVGLLVLVAPLSSKAQTDSPSAADSASRAAEIPSAAGLPDAGEKPPFELPEVVVRGEDLSVVAGGSRLAAGLPVLDVSPTERPKNPLPPEMGDPWRRARPFRLVRERPNRRPCSPTWWRVGARSEPGIFGSLTTGGSCSGPSAWRLTAGGEWVEDPVPETSRQGLDLRVDRGRGHWLEEPHWGLSFEGAIRRTDWDLPSVAARGPQIFSGLRGAAVKWWRGSMGAVRLEAGQFRPYRGANEARWSSAELRWDLGSAREHPFFWEPAVSVRAHGMLGEQEGSSTPGRTWGEIHAGAPVSKALWVGARGSWDEDRLLVGPRLLLRWGDVERRVALWARVETRLGVDSWWEESRRRDFALLDLERSATGEAPSISLGADVERARWILHGRVSTRRLRSPRTWREDPGSGLMAPVSASGRWVADALVRIVSPPMAPVRLEIETGFFDDGRGEVLALRPAVWGEARIWASAGGYTAALELSAKGESPVNAGHKLPGSLLLHVEAGRFVGALGRIWVRLNNVTDDPAPVWPFVDGSRRAVLVGWDFVPRELRDSF